MVVHNNVAKIGREQLCGLSILLNDAGIEDFRIEIVPWDHSLVGVTIIGGVSPDTATRLQSHPDAKKYRLQVAKLTGQPT